MPYVVPYQTNCAFELELDTTPPTLNRSQPVRDGTSVRVRLRTNEPAEIEVTALDDDVTVDVEPVSDMVNIITLEDVPEDLVPITVEIVATDEVWNERLFTLELYPVYDIDYEYPIYLLVEPSVESYLLVVDKQIIVQLERNDYIIQLAPSISSDLFVDQASTSGITVEDAQVFGVTVEEAETTGLTVEDSAVSGVLIEDYKPPTE